MSELARSEDILDVVEKLNTQLSHQSTATRGLIEAMRIERDERRQLSARVAKIEDQADLTSRHWSVATWISYHGYSASIDALKEEGGILRGICLSHGIPIGDKKICNGSQWPARQWPIEAIRLWWPGCCARHGWKLTWKV